MKHCAPAGTGTLQDGAATQQVDTLLSNPGVESKEAAKSDANGQSESPQEQQPEGLMEHESLETPLPEKLQSLKISSNNQGSVGEEADPASEPEGDSGVLRGKLQNLRGGLKGKSAVKEQRLQHKAKKGYLIKGYVQTIHLRTICLHEESV